MTDHDAVDAVKAFLYLGAFFIAAIALFALGAR